MISEDTPASLIIVMATTYNAIEDYGLIGDMHTCALVSKQGSLDYMCWPVFDSPSIFCRLLDTKKGGYFSACPHAQCPQCQ